MPRPPIRQDAFGSSVPSNILPEVAAQLDARQKRRAAERKRARPKATYDLPARVLAAVDEVADQESVAKSDIVALAIVRFVQAYREGGVELDKVQARSLRYSWKVQLPEDWRR